jgi:hypothetical protein
MPNDKGKVPTQITKWDFFALIADTTAAILIDIASGFDILTQMFEHQASFVDDKNSFHEYAARTIETLQEGE